MSGKGKGKQIEEDPPSSGSKSSQAHRRGASVEGSSASKQREMQGNWRRSMPPGDVPQPSTPKRVQPAKMGSPSTSKSSNPPSSPSRPPAWTRGSVNELFGNLDISGSSRGSPRTPTGPTQTTSRPGPRFATFSKLPGGFPNWCTLKRPDGGESPLELLIKQASHAFNYERQFGGEDRESKRRCESAFNDAREAILAIRGAVKQAGGTIDAILEEHLVESMGKMIFGSNAIEKVGENERETMKLCREVLLNKRNYLDSVPTRSPEYFKQLEDAINEGAASVGMRPDRARGRREVVNHAAAFLEMTNAVVKSGQPFTEDLIKNCHKILCHEVDAENGDGPPRPWRSYAGVYRSNDATDVVRAGNTSFVRPGAVASAMARFVKDLNEQLRVAELAKSMDPFLIAANACGEFVNIHPFFDGNGRTCRLLLNTIVLKYAGVVCPFGELHPDRKVYLEVTKRRSDEEVGNGELAGLCLKYSQPGLQTLRQKLYAARK